MKPRGILVTVALAVLLAFRISAAPLPQGEKEATLKFAASLQNPDGGFRPSAAAAPSGLGPTVHVLRTFHYLGGTPPNREGALRFVRSCRDAGTGGYGETPGAKPDVRSSAMGLMALSVLKTPLGEQAEGLRGYFRDNAKTLGDIYIAEAALSAAELRPPDAQTWMAVFAATRNSDGTYGKSISDTARAVITALRMHLAVPGRSDVLKSLRAAQKPDGGFAAMGDASDLGTTYPVVRAFFMLDDKPDLQRLKSFVASCRNADGGYGPQPGQPSGSAGTYYAAIVLHWADELGAKR